jgi:hypothetical protein
VLRVCRIHSVEVTRILEQDCYLNNIIETRFSGLKNALAILDRQICLFLYSRRIHLLRKGIEANNPGKEDRVSDLDGMTVQSRPRNLVGVDDFPLHPKAADGNGLVILWIVAKIVRSAPWRSKPSESRLGSAASATPRIFGGSPHGRYNRCKRDCTFSRVESRPGLSPAAEARNPNGRWNRNDQ